MLALLGVTSLHITFPTVLSSCSPRCLLPLLSLCATSTSSNQGLYHFSKDFSRILFPFFMDSTRCEKEPWVYVCLVVRQHEQFYPECLSVFAPLGTCESGLDKVSSEIRGLSSTDCNFQGLSRCARSGTLSNSHVCPLHLLLTSTFPYYSSLLCYPGPTRAWGPLSTDLS